MAVNWNDFTPIDAPATGASVDWSQFEVIKPIKRTAGESVTDLGASAASGVGSVVEGAGTLYGFASGNMDNALREFGKGVSEYWNERKSPGLLAKEAGRREKIDATEGQFGKAWAAIRETATSPALFSTFLSEQLPMLVPGMAIGRGAGVAAKVLGATEKVASRTALGTGVGTFAAQQGADVGSDTYDRITKLPQEMFDSHPAYMALVQSGLDPKQAKDAVAQDEAKAAALRSAGISLATMLVPGGTTVERLLVGSGMGKTAASGIVRGMLGESVQEASEEGGGQVMANLGVRAVDPSQTLTEGVGEAAGMGGLMGGVFGGGAGAVSGSPQAAPTPAPTPPVEPSQPRIAGLLPPPAPIQVTPEGVAGTAQQFEEMGLTADVRRAQAKIPTILAAPDVETAIATAADAVATVDVRATVRGEEEKALMLRNALGVMEREIQEAEIATAGHEAIGEEQLERAEGEARGLPDVQPKTAMQIAFDQARARAGLTPVQQSAMSTAGVQTPSVDKPSVRIPQTPEDAKTFTDHALDLARNLTRSSVAREIIDAETQRRANEPTTGMTAPNVGTPESGTTEPVSSTAVVPSGDLFVEYGGKRYPVQSIQDAQRKWSAARDADVRQGGGGVSNIGNGIVVSDSGGKPVARISYNGRAWDATTGKELYPEKPDAQSKAALDKIAAANARGDTAEATRLGEAFAGETIEQPRNVQPIEQPSTIAAVSATAEMSNQSGQTQPSANPPVTSIFGTPLGGLTRQQLTNAVKVGNRRVKEAAQAEIERRDAMVAEKRAAASAAGTGVVQQQRTVETRMRQESLWQRLMTGQNTDAVVTEMSDDEARAALDRLNAAPGDNPAARKALEARVSPQPAAPESGQAIPLVGEMLQAGKESVEEARSKVSDVKLGPIENGKETILFTFDGKPHKGVLEGRNRDLVVGSSAEADKAIALRTYLDGAAKPVKAAAPSSPREQPLQKREQPVQQSPAFTEREQAAGGEQRITDVGENLWYNRRNFTGKALGWNDVKGLNDTLKLKEVVKSKVWPRPDYEQLVADGLQPFFARFIKQVYDGIGVTPAGKSDADLQRYIDVVGRVREAVFDWAKDNNANKEFLDAIVAKAQRRTHSGPVSISSMYEASKKEHDIRKVIMDRVWPETVGQGRPFSLERPLADIRAIGGNRAAKAIQFTMDDAVTAMKEIEKGWPAKQEAWQKQGYRIVPSSKAAVNEGAQYGKDGTKKTMWFVASSDGWSGRTIGEGHDTKAAADAAKAALKPFMLLEKRGKFVGDYDTQAQAEEAAREQTKRETKGGDLRGMNIEESERKGPARRGADENVSPQRLQDEFGFRGVNFGREGWINQNERQAYLNHAYDGLLDLAELLDVPPKALSLNGLLGIAFGAQGRGGSNAAHFVPGVNEINLTKTKGAGTLAHEWGHALDHYFGTQAGLSKSAEPFLSEHAERAVSGEIRPEIVARFKAIVDAMNKRAMTEEEARTQTNSYRSVALRSLEGWLATFKNMLVSAKDKERVFAEFDQLAGRLRRGELGDGYVKSGNMELRPVIAQMRNLVKDVTGRVPDSETTKGLASNAGHLSYLLNTAEATAEHEPQTTSTTYKRESYAADRDKGGKRYWATATEMFARAFETYVADKLAELAQGNTFLSDAALRAEMRNREGTGYAMPYPRNDDRKAINEAIDKLVGEIQTKETDRGVAMFSRRAPTAEDNRASTAFTLLSENDEIFRYPRSEEKELNDVVADLDPDLNVVEFNMGQIGGNYGPAVSRVFEIRGDRRNMAEVVQTKKGEVWINIAQFNEGKGGSAIYAAVGDYAHNAGLKFIGDPHGLSTVALYRRTEAMLSSALRHGTTRHLEPHEYQTEGDAKLGVKPLAWKPGDDVANLKSLIQAHYDNVVSGLPEMADMEYDFEHGNFTENGKPIGDERFVELATRPGAREARAGRNTLKRAAFAGSLLRQEGGEGWQRILGSVLRQSREQLDSALRGLLYSRKAPPSAGLSISTRDAQAVLDRIAPKYKNLPPVHLLQSPAELPARVKELRDYIRKAGAQNDVEGVFHEGEIWMFTDHIADEARFEHVLFNHELAHYGLRGTLGRDLDPVLNYIFAKNKTVRDAAIAHRKQYDVTSNVEAVEEVLADMNPEELVKLTGFNRMLVTIRNWLASHGFENLAARVNALLEARVGEQTASDAFVSDLVQNARDWAKNGGKDAGPRLYMGGTRLSDAADDADTRFSRAPGNRATWDAEEPGKLDTFIRVLQDKQIDTKRVVQAIKNASGALADSLDVYLQEELFHGRTAKAVQDFLDAEMTPMLKEMSARGVTMPELEEYLHARHAEERNAQIAKINPDMPDGGSGLTTKDARAYLAKLDPQKRRAYESLAKRVADINDKTRQELVAYGLESPATIKAWESAYKHYVPLHREDMDGGPGTGQGFSVKGPASKRATGSKKAVVDILANVAMQRERAIVRGEKNRVANALIGLAEANPNPSFWRVDRPPKIKTVDERTGLVREMVDPLYKSRENVIIARIPDAKGEIVEHSVLFNERDERAANMVAALKNLDAHDLGEVLSASAKITRYFASINTQYNPVFGVVNLTRDTQGALLNLSTTPIAGKQWEVLRHTMSALKGIYFDQRAAREGNQPQSQWADLWDEFQKEGGQTGYRDMFRTSKDRAEAIEREIKRVSEGKAQQFGRAIFDWLSDYNTAMENAVRLASYRVAKESGISKQRAASLAKNLTVNFNRKGQIGVQAGSLYAFFNASVQGTARLAETLRGPMGKKIITGGLLLGAAQAVLLAAAGFDDDEPPDFVRERSLILPIGDKKYLTLPMPLGLHVIPNLARIPTEYALSGFKDPGKRISQLVNLIADAFNPVGNAGLSLQTISPSAIDPIAALAENKDWTGKPIAREDFNKLAPTPGHTRAKDTATQFSKTVSKALNWMSGGTEYKPGLFSPTPDQIDYLVGQVTGGLGREALKAEQTVGSAFTGEELPTYKIPLLGRFYGNAEGQAGESQKFYNALREINEHEAEIKGRAKAGEPVAEYLADNPEARLWKAANTYERRVSLLRRRKRELVKQDADAETIKAIDQQITATMQRFNELVASVKK